MRRVFPCFFGSVLKLDGVEEFLNGIGKYTEAPSYPKNFGARVFKISRDEKGNRMTHMKITGGRLKVRDIVSNGDWEEKVTQIRIYSGQKYEAVNEVKAGTVCAVTGHAGKVRRRAGREKHIFTFSNLYCHTALYFPTVIRGYASKAQGS